jgi:hypothetical protein
LLGDAPLAAGQRTPRGSTVWLALDTFGADVLASLAPWIGGAEHLGELTDANRLLAVLGADGGTAGRGITALTAADEAPAAVLAAIGSLLAGPHSRAARSRGATGALMLVPHLWVVYDFASPAADCAVSTIEAILERLEAEGIFVRLYLLARNVTWQRDEATKDKVVAHAGAIVDRLLASDRTAHGRTMVFVVSDFDGVNGRYEPDECTAAARNFAEFVLVTDAPRSRLTGIEQAFVPPADEAGAAVGRVAHRAFAAIGALALHYPVAEALAARAAARQPRFYAEMSEPAAATWQPSRIPHLERPDASAGPPWTPLRLPRWHPSLWRRDRVAYRQAARALDEWLSEAERWRHQEIVTCIQKRDRIWSESGQAIADYREELEGEWQAILAADEHRGIFAPLRRLLERTQADLAVTRAETGPPPSEPPPPITEEGVLATIPPPEKALPAADQELAKAIERRTNAILVSIVALVSAALAIFWIIRIAKSFQDSFVGWLLNRIPVARFPSWLSWLGDWIVRVRNWQAVDTTKLVFWTVTLTLLFVGGAVLLIFLKERAALERSFDRLYRRARGWRESARKTLPDALEKLAEWRFHENLASAEQELRLRHDRLTALQEWGQAFRQPEPPTPPPFTRLVYPHLDPIAPLSDADVHHVLMGFRRGAAAEYWLTATPAQFFDMLLTEAATYAGDREPDARLEIARLQEELAAALPGTTGVVARPGPGPQSNAYWHFSQFAAVPARLVDDFNPARAGCPVLPVPAGERLYAVAIQNGLNAAELFG